MSEEEVQEQFRKCLKLYQKRFHFLQSEAAKKLGVKFSSFQKWEQGIRSPKIVSIIRVSEKMREDMLEAREQKKIDKVEGMR